MYDVVVVGAGPSGSTAAYYCAKNGLKTLLLEKEKIPRVKTCGGGFGLVFHDVPEEVKPLVKQKTEKLRLLVGKLKIDFPISLHMFERKDLDHRG